MAMELQNTEMPIPMHPGEIIRWGYMARSGTSKTATAKNLGVARKGLTDILNGRASISADMAIRFERAGWGRAVEWMLMQLEYNLWKAGIRAHELESMTPPSERTPNRTLYSPDTDNLVRRMYARTAWFGTAYPCIVNTVKQFNEDFALRGSHLRFILDPSTKLTAFFDIKEASPRVFLSFSLDAHGSVRAETNVRGAVNLPPPEFASKVTDRWTQKVVERVMTAVLDGRRL
jgi:addiction module HigA family antidote